MKFRDIQLRALLVPLCVALIPVGVLLWYGFVSIPLQEADLNARNFRLLTTMSAAVRAKIESFDGALDHAAESFTAGTEKDNFAKGVHLFAPDLDVIRVARPRVAPCAVDEIECRMLGVAADPPRVAIERDEGRYFLYLGAKPPAGDGQAVTIVARSDVESVVEPLLAGRNDAFDGILLATDSGEVIAQHAPIGLSLARLDGVIRSRTIATGSDSNGKDTGAKDAAAKDAPAPRLGFASLTAFSNLVPVTIGEVQYKLYMQPVPLSLLSMKDAANRTPEQWVLCGLVRVDRFRADSSAFSYTNLIGFSGLLALLVLAFPFVKLRGLGSRERLRDSDTGWVAIASVLLLALVTFAALDSVTFRLQVRSAVDTRLEEVALRIRSSVNSEVTAIDEQARAFESGSFGHTSINERFPAVSQLLKLSDALTPRIVVDKHDSRTVWCDPPMACETNLVDAGSGKVGGAYPFFDLVTWSGEDGWQRVRGTSGQAMRPFLNIFNEGLSYAQTARSAWRTPQAAAKGISMLSSPNTGEALVVFWRIGPRSGLPRVQSLAVSNLVSLDQPLLPKGTSFAVVDDTGEVLFHSIRTRRLRENFLKESQDNAGLAARFASSDEHDPVNEDPVTAVYEGREVRVFVTPLTLERFTVQESPGWRLVVFQDSTTVDTVNLETLTVASLLFAIYASLLAAAAIAAYSSAPKAPRKWFWPDPAKASAYRSAAAINAAAVLIFVVFCSAGALLHLPSSLLLVGTIALSGAAVVRTFRIVTRAATTPEPALAFGPAHPFFLARAAFLAVVAVLPAIACFQTAYEYEATLLARADGVQRESDQGLLDAANRSAFESFRLNANTAEDFIEKRKAFTTTQSALPLWPVVAANREPGILDPVLGRMHRLYNPVANDLAAASRQPTNQQPSSAPNVAWLFTLVVALCLVCYAVVYWFVKPMFVLGAVAAHAATAESLNASADHVLVVGPPGSGKSTRLAKESGISVFDVPIAAYGERRTKQAPVPVEHRRALPAAVGGFARGEWESFRAAATEPSASTTPVRPECAANWADTLDYSALPPFLGIDHVEHRLEEREFAGETLTFVERVSYREGSRVHIVADRDPLACLRDSGAPAPEIARWVRVLRTYRKEYVGIADDALAASGAEASPYFEAIWTTCTMDERLALRQLAEEGVVNPRNQAVARDLMRAGLIVRDPTVRFTNGAFREFVLNAASSREVREWERRGVAIPWSSIEIAMLVTVLTLAGLLVVTQEHLLSAWIGFIPAFVPAAQRLWKALSGLQPAKAAGN